MPKMEDSNTYKLEGGDGGAYGPEFGPVLADEVRIIEAEEGGNSYLMLKLQEPIQYESDQINYFVVSPRYVGDSLKKLRQKGCIVGVGRVLPGQEAAVQEKGVSNETVEYWSIGSCTPMQQRHNKWLQWTSALTRRRP